MNRMCSNRQRGNELHQTPWKIEGPQQTPTTNLTVLWEVRQGAKNRPKNTCYFCQRERTKELRGQFICLLGLTFAVLSAAEEYTRNWRSVIHILAAKILH